MDRISKLFLGADVPTGGIVSRIALDRFLTDAVAPGFPGFTLQEGEGFWEGKSEGVWILTIVHDSKADTIRDVHRIALAYKATFGQTAVLVVSAVVDARLV